MFLTIGLIVAFVCSFFFFAKINHFDFIDAFHSIFKASSKNDTLVVNEEITGSQKPIEPPPKNTVSALQQNTITSQDPLEMPSGQLPDKEISENGPDTHQSDLQTSHVPANQNVGEDQPQKLVNELTSFYYHLDQQPYMQEFHLKEPSKIHFSKLLQILIDNPPVVTRETDDYFILLKNTAHFFRILGKENMLALKGILDREKDSFERILKIFYNLTEHPEYLKKDFSLTIPNENLVDYAGFFLNTIGGRLYLFRRDSVSRMTVSFYAIMILDKANQQGNNRLGIDLSPSIDSLIDEMENAGSNLKFKNEYLDTLYDLKENYGNRG